MEARSHGALLDLPRLRAWRPVPCRIGPQGAIRRGYAKTASCFVTRIYKGIDVHKRLDAEPWDPWSSEAVRAAIGPGIASWEVKRAYRRFHPSQLGRRYLALAGMQNAPEPGILSMFPLSDKAEEMYVERTWRCGRVRQGPWGRLRGGPSTPRPAWSPSRTRLHAPAGSARWPAAFHGQERAGADKLGASDYRTDCPQLKAHVSTVA